MNDTPKSIGASNSAAALGVCPWKSKFEYWSELTGLTEPPDLSEKEAVEWGNILEPVIAETYARKTGRKVEHNANAEVTRHPDRPFLTATLDAVQTDDACGVGALEIKTTSAWRGDDWAEEPPLHYQVQLQHQLAVTGMPWGTLCCLIGGQRLIYWDQHRNDKFIEAMIDKLSFFWTQVIDRIPPAPDGSESTAKVLKQLYPADDGEIVALPMESANWDRELVAAKETIKRADAKKRLAENRIKAALGSASIGILPDGARYSYKKQTVNHKAKEAYTSTYRVLRRKKQ